MKSSSFCKKEMVLLEEKMVRLTNPVTSSHMSQAIPPEVNWTLEVLPLLQRCNAEQSVGPSRYLSANDAITSGS